MFENNQESIFLLECRVHIVVKDSTMINTFFNEVIQTVVSWNEVLLALQILRTTHTYTQNSVSDCKKQKTHNITHFHCTANYVNTKLTTGGSYRTRYEPNMAIFRSQLRRSALKLNSQQLVWVGEEGNGGATMDFSSSWLEPVQLRELYYSASLGFF